MSFVMAVSNANGCTKKEFVDMARRGKETTIGQVDSK